MQDVSATLEISSYPLNEAEFRKISHLMYSLCRVNLQAGKQDLVKSRLSKRLRTLGLQGFGEYLALLDSDPHEVGAMVDALTTNKTSFFREPQHFDFLSRTLLPQIAARSRKLRLWSAGCSSGEEAYTLAMVLREHLPDIDRRDVRILATDISSRILALAREGVYSHGAVGDVPAAYLDRYFQPILRQGARHYQVRDSLRSMVRLARLNLMDSWPMRGPFDAIFCRNVMIYFDRPTQQGLVRRFYDLLEPGGHLFVGHSESLTGSDSAFRYVQPAVYVR